MSLSTLLSLDNDVFLTYTVWSSILSVKTLAMSALTVRQRRKTKTVSNPEDLKLIEGSKVNFTNADVERVRRAHQNDLENILFFIPVGFFYILTDPEPNVAKHLFRAVGVARIVHTLSYAFGPVPQPVRGIAFSVAYLSTGYMAVKSICYFYKNL